MGDHQTPSNARDCASKFGWGQGDITIIKVLKNWGAAE